MQKTLVKLNIITTLIIVISAGFLFTNLVEPNSSTALDMAFDEQDATIRSISRVQPAVVSIIVYDEEDVINFNVSTGEQSLSTEQAIKGRGTGFLISSDGYIITNKHVVNSAGERGSYRIILNSGKQYYGQLIGRDKLNDLAVLKIFDENLPFIELGDSDRLQIGSSVIAIGNVLGTYQNSATKGIVSGLGRNILAAGDGGAIESLDNVIQTDAEINHGNSGGPLINLEGKVVGINVAVDESGTAIGFAIPINDARPVIKSILESGRIIRPRLGLRYTMLNPEIALDNGLARTSGAWLNGGDEQSAIIEGGPADKAGLETGDIIFEINAIKLEGSNTLLSVVQRYKPGDRIGMKVQRGEKVLILEATLDEF